MNASRLLLKAFAHVTAGGGVIALSAGLAVVSYFGLLAWALVAGSQIGGPLGLLGLLLPALVGSLTAVLVALLPVTVTAEIVVGRLLRAPRLIEIPVATLLLLLEAVAIAAIVTWIRDGDGDLVFALKAGTVTWLVLLIPLGLYWWILRANDAASWLATAAWAQCRAWRERGRLQRSAG